MNYKEINKAILEGRDVDECLIKKDGKFYEYLFNNKVAFYYSKYLSKNKTEKEKLIIVRGEELNKKYYKTLELLNSICEKNHINFLLYKTHKYIPGVVDGDIDIFVKNEDFQKFLNVFSNEGFFTEEDEPGKGKCEKEGYCVIEPHVSISWRGGKYVKEDYIWKNIRSVENSNNIKTCSYEIELASLVGKVFFEPQYLDLFSIKSITFFTKQNIDKKEILDNIYFSEAFLYLIKNLEKHIQPSGKIPIFLNSFYFIYFWGKQCWFNKNWRYFALHILYFFYWKYRYFLSNKLPFSHKW